MTTFDTTVIQKRATSLAFYQRQLFTTPPLTSPDKVDLAGKTAIITGSNTGLGFECAQQLLDLGLSKLILAVRNETKGEEARGKLLSGRNADNHSIQVWKLDLLCYGSIVSFVERTKGLERLDFFVNNAAFTRLSFAINEKTGHEGIIQVNYFSLALLTILILPVLRDKNSAQQPGRLVNVSSDTASWATIVTQHPSYLRQLFLAQLARRVPPSIAVINTPNPGLCQTSLTRDFKGSLQGILFGIFRLIFARTAAIGARSITDAVVNHGSESHGQYLEDGTVQPMAPFVYTDKGEEVAELLWEETMTELSFANVSEILEDLSN
ncbi:short-chain dehydrogenase/reductase [Trichophyton equinum CBS 127.97]|uniref:Short-chain dehydrogenase/reductase n=1 Tax=Trichophyton equinum (strain ATCC MYA-4606 / CBS 127.97) TaxID=559882 RepID=F2PVX0_TRIEC|nr:short-chain dehydrogenase/reductase [Trichophyton equinum CBS 127.97]